MGANGKAYRRVNLPRPVWSRFSTVTVPARCFPERAKVTPDRPTAFSPWVR